MKKWREILNNYPYILWVLLYATLLWVPSGANMQAFQFVGSVYVVCLFVACTPFSEWLWRLCNRVRPLATSQEKERLMPIFDEVYAEAQKVDENIFKNIQIYIKDNMEINASAYGRGTLVLTKGSVEMIGDEELRGIIAHEMGHFSHYDTVALLFAQVSNVLMTLFMNFVRLIIWVITVLTGIAGVPAWFCRILFSPFELGFRLLIFIGDLILMRVSRQQEYLADKFAMQCGYGENLVSALYILNQIYLSEPKNFFKELLNTHPPLAMRIERLENIEI